MTTMVKAVLNGKYDLVIPDHRAARPQWLPENGGWEARRTDALHHHIRKGDVVYYVGAEEGEFPALCQKWGAEVFLWEPNPKVWSNIRAIWEANDLDTPMCFPGFASAETATLGVEPGREWPPSAYEDIIAAHGFKELHLEADNYPQLTIDDMFRLTGKAPKHIAFDVEGSEWQVLRGATDVLKKFKPILYASIHPEMMALHWGEWSRDFRNWLGDLGYQETILDYEHELHCLYR